MTEINMLPNNYIFKIWAQMTSFWDFQLIHIILIYYIILGGGWMVIAHQVYNNL